jgi:SAM-dependent methyltransferase
MEPGLLLSLKDGLIKQFGHIDIYLFDQLLKGRFDSCTRLLDAGCGDGRNIVFFLQKGLDVYAVDRDPEAIKEIRKLAAHLAPHLPPGNFQTAGLEQLPFPDGRFDAVIGSAVLHFAENESHFLRMLDELWRVLKPQGLFFTRLASSIGLESRIQPVPPGERRRFKLPDGSKRFLVDEAMLLAAAERLKGTLLEPIKTTNVQNLRCMTTWCLRKDSAPRDQVKS